MTRQQAERKAMELYPRLYPGTNESILNAIHRAAFMQCFDLMPTGSLPMTREEAEKWLNERFQHWSKDYLNCGKYMALAMYSHLASLSSAAPAMRWVKANQEIPHDYDWVDTHFMLDGKKSDGCLDRQEGGKIVFEYRSANGWQVVEDLSRVEWLDETSAPAPVGVTREAECPYPELMFPELSDAKLKIASFAIEAAGISSPQYTANIARFVWKQAVKALTAPVSSAAQPATGYSEDQVRDAMDLRVFTDSTPDEIISSLNKKP